MLVIVISAMLLKLYLRKYPYPVVRVGVKDIDSAVDDVGSVVMRVAA